VAAQWLAWAMKVPAILLLLLFGFGVGPLSQWIHGAKLLDPDHLLGSVLFPIVSLSVAVILFEGGLTLNLADIRQVGRALGNLVTFGAMVTWAIVTFAGVYVLALPMQIALLLGAILVVTGPTVIGPLLRHVKPVGQVGPLLKWEGIVIDPIGAVLALLVFEAVQTPQKLEHLAATMLVAIFKTLLIGGALGIVAAVLLIILFRRYWIADYLESPVVLMFVIAAFTASNLLKDESGLLAVTVMGIILANQKQVPFHHVLKFKENLTILLVSSLFIMLGARLDSAQMKFFDRRTGLFLLILILVARPVSVCLSTIRSSLNRRERAFVSLVAPRGIVAASVAAVFSIRLRSAGLPEADRLVPLVFAVIVCTVLVYGLGAKPLAVWLGLTAKGSGGFVIAGANALARAIATALQQENRTVLLVDTNPANISAARLANLATFPQSATSEGVLERVEGSGINQLLALTPNEEVNSLAALHFGRIFGRSSVFQLAAEARETKTSKQKVSHELSGRVLFAPNLTYETLAERIASGAKIKRTKFSDAFTFEKYNDLNKRATPLFLINETGDLQVITADMSLLPKPGQTLVSLVDAQASDPMQTASSA
ncbi:MAG TPA: cation:proton antiporter, partial [Tepidisphaeraceae bacterium]|nr:cation:proton antiporter [Tepidisphaeraceae bacterium]